VRLAVDDDAVQAAEARAALDQAEVVVCTLQMLCEVVWVLSRFYEMPTEEIVLFLQMLLSTEKMQFDRSAVEFGISALLAGGNFADGAIAEVGRRQGADIFLTFDRKAQRAIGRLGIPVAQPGQVET
jgi:predicted nucleic-acid-binding protein